jgi:drug/metabolite transporter (DMT)-like permease
MTDITVSQPVSGTARLGVMLMLLGMVMFSLNDVLGKWLVATYSVGQLMLIRSLAAMLVLAPFFWKVGWRRLVEVERPKLHFVRAFLFAFEASAFYFAVAYMLLADAMTYWLAAPIYVAAMSPLLLGEKVGWRRWTAIIVGFVGVVIALEPSKDTFTLPALIALAGIRPWSSGRWRARRSSPASGALPIPPAGRRSARSISRCSACSASWR